MKAPVEWLREYVDCGDDAAAVARALTSAGLSVEAVEEHPTAGAVLELEVTSNRPDCHGIIGVARELAAALGKPLRLPDLGLSESSREASSLCSVEVPATDLCPRYTARVVEGVTVGPSPGWMARRLEGAGLRPINNVVDVTNYVLLEMCQPLHAFDIKRLRDSKIIVRRAGEREKMNLLDGRAVEMSPERLVIADPSGPVALAGVMGGLESEVSSGTKCVLIESAQFDRVNVRRTARSLGLSTEASYRFERGVDPVGVELASRRAAKLLAELAGGKVARGVVDAWAAPWTPVEVQLRFARVGRLLGFEIEPGDALRILTALGLEVIRRDAARASFRVPPWRPDLEGEADLIEEVARVWGYDRVPEKLTLKITAPGRNPPDELRRAARRLVCSLGYDEAMTDSFVDERGPRFFRMWSQGRTLAVSNPLSQMQSTLRESLLPNLLVAKRTNQDAGLGSVRLFEVGKVYLADGAGEPGERTTLALVDDDGFFAAKGTLESLFEEMRLSPGPIEFYENPPAPFEGGRAVEFRVEAPGGRAELLAVLGEMPEEVRRAYDLDSSPAMAEIDLDLLLGAAKERAAFRALPRFPAVTRDVALIVKDSLNWSGVRAAAMGLIGKNPAFAGLQFVSVYSGKPIPEGRKSVALRVTYRAPDRTLTDDEVNAAHAEFTAKVCAELNATIRGA